MDADAKNKLSDEELYAQMRYEAYSFVLVILFNRYPRMLLIVGHESTSHTINWTLFELARNPDVQTRLRAEIRDRESAMRSRGDSQFTVTDLEGMPYMAAIIKASRVSLDQPVTFAYAVQCGRNPLGIIPQRPSFIACPSGTMSCPFRSQLRPNRGNLCTRYLFPKEHASSFLFLHTIGMCCILPFVRWWVANGCVAGTRNCGAKMLTCSIPIAGWMARSKIRRNLGSGCMPTCETTLGAYHMTATTQSFFRMSFGTGHRACLGWRFA